MTARDAIRWNARYQEPRYAGFLAPRRFLTQHAGRLPRAGWALDIAMGMGGTAGFLLERGLRVVGVDISTLAVRAARRRLPALDALVADLDAVWLPPRHFDVVCNFYFLKRGLLPALCETLKPGGLLFFETLTAAMRERLPDVDPSVLLEPGELPGLFPGWEVLDYREGWMAAERGGEKATASLLARKPASAPHSSGEE